MGEWKSQKAVLLAPCIMAVGAPCRANKIVWIFGEVSLSSSTCETGCNILPKVVRGEGGSINKLFNRELQIFAIRPRLSAVGDSILCVSYLTTWYFLGFNQEILHKQHISWSGGRQKVIPSFVHYDTNLWRGCQNEWCSHYEAHEVYFKPIFHLSKGWGGELWQASKVHFSFEQNTERRTLNIGCCCSGRGNHY